RSSRRPRPRPPSPIAAGCRRSGRASPTSSTSPATTATSPAGCIARAPARTEGYTPVGLYPDAQPGEIFLKMAKEGSTVSGLMDSFATTVSVALQYGVPLRDLVNKFAHVRFEPSGFTGNQEIPIAKSIVDYIFRWLGSRFLGSDDKAMLGLVVRSAMGDSYAGFGAPAAARGASCSGVRAP